MNSNPTSSSPKTLGRAQACDLVIEHDSVSRVHARVQVSEEGYLVVEDAQSSNGTFLCRNGHWVRAQKVFLGQRDRIRFGDEEVELDRLLELFETHVRLRLRDEPVVHGDVVPRKEVLEHPRRNPLTGKIEENR